MFIDKYKCLDEKCEKTFDDVASVKVHFMRTHFNIPDYVKLLRENPTGIMKEGRPGIFPRVKSYLEELREYTDQSDKDEPF